MNLLHSEAQTLFDYTKGIRRDLHRHPELGFQEFRTSGIVAKELMKLDLEVRTGIAETGVVGLLELQETGPVVLARFDMDALPIQEETGAEYASQNEGIMHACGHDGHTAVGLTVARLLHARKDELKGAVKFVFQPAEEGLGGAERMISEGVLDNPHPQIALAFHFWNERPVGWIGVSEGPTMAAAEIFNVKIYGKGGHGAVPNLAVDPIIATASIITGIQSIVARNVSPLETAVISVCSVSGGEAFNVIPSLAEMKGTIRTFNPDIRKIVLDRFNQLVHGIAKSYGCEAEIELRSITPAVKNDRNVAGKVKQVVMENYPDFALDSNFLTMGSEDMAFMMQDIPGCYIFIGSANPDTGMDFPHHHPRFDFDENALPIAAGLMANTIINFLSD